jgi:hypothetical protein
LNLKLPDNKNIQKFEDIGKWWANCERNEENTVVLHNVEYGLWQKGWEIELEQTFMKMNNWEYCNKSEESIKENCKRKNYVIMGCVGKT